MKRIYMIELNGARNSEAGILSGPFSSRKRLGIITTEGTEVRRGIIDIL